MPPNPDSEAEAAGGEGLRGSCRQSLKEEKASPPRSPSQRSLPDEAFSAEDATAPEDEARGEEQRETDGLCEGEAGQRSENERKEAKRDDCWSHDSQPPMTGPQVVQYCIRETRVSLALSLAALSVLFADPSKTDAVLALPLCLQCAAFLPSTASSRTRPVDQRPRKSFSRSLRPRPQESLSPSARNRKRC